MTSRGNLGPLKSVAVRRARHRVLDRVAPTGGSYPEMMVGDNRPGLRSSALDESAYTHGVVMAFIEPARPMQNVFIAGVDVRFLDWCLDENFFINLNDARTTIDAWILGYETIRPHGRGRYTPMEFAKAQQA